MRQFGAQWTSPEANLIHKCPVFPLAPSSLPFSVQFVLAYAGHLIWECSCLLGNYNLSIPESLPCQAYPCFASSAISERQPNSFQLKTCIQSKWVEILVIDQLELYLLPCVSDRMLLVANKRKPNQPNKTAGMYSVYLTGKFGDRSVLSAIRSRLLFSLSAVLSALL